MASVSIWTTEIVQQTLEKLRMGIVTDMSCFHAGDIELKAGNILYQLTPQERDEFYKCSRDIIYFVEKHCRFLTDFGRMTVALRKYQKEILDTLGKETYNEKYNEFIPDVRNLIMMQSRQSGKCFFTGDILIKYPDDSLYKIPISLFYYMILSKERKLTFLEKLKIKLLMAYMKLNK